MVLSTPALTVHTLMAPAAVFSVTSHVLEFKSQLFVVDGQFFSPYAADLKAYVDKLGKPVTRFYISHEHPDHCLGMGEAFPDVTVYALPQVRHHIEEDGPKQIARWTARLGPNMVAQRLTLPSRDAKPGREVVDGRRTIEQDLTYLDTVDRIRHSAADAADYKAQLLRAFPNHAGAALVDIYLPLVYPASR